MLTIDVTTLLLCLLIFAGVVLVVFLIVAAYNLIKTLKQSQKVLADLEVVASITSKRTQQIDKVLEQTSKRLKAGQSILNAFPIIFQAIAKIAKLVGQKKENS